MNLRSKLVRWIAPFLLGVLLTPIAAIAGTLTAIALTNIGCLVSLTTMTCSDFFLVGIVVGTMFAVSCTALLIPILCIGLGNKMPPGLFAFLCSVFGLATMLAIESLLQFSNPSHLRGLGPNPFPVAAMVGALAFGIIYFLIIQLIKGRLSPRLPYHDEGATQ
jgi:hypothetical protein